MATVKNVMLVLAAIAAAGVLLAWLVVRNGWVDVSATGQHSRLVYLFLDGTLKQTVRARARDIQVPSLDGEERLARGARCYQAKCVQCHGGPGVSPGDVGKGMQPLPGPLVDARSRWTPRELYWVTRHGIKMSGMPAWQYRLSDEELWDVVAFVDALPGMSPERFARLAGTTWQVSSDALSATGAPLASCGRAAQAPPQPADAELGRAALYQYACTTCHIIPGTAQGNPQVGPSLAGVGRRARIAGVLDNTEAQMVRWLRETQQIKPGTAMPQLGVSDQDARDIAAYLHTLR